jgi:hypothetical protein
MSQSRLPTQRTDADRATRARSAGTLFWVAAALACAGSASAGESYDKEATDVVLKRAARQVKENCGHAKNEDGRLAGPWGTTRVTVTLGRNGRSKGASIPAPFEGTPTGKCAVQAFSNLTFPPFAGSDVTLDWEVEIVKPDADSTAKSKRKP